MARRTFLAWLAAALLGLSGSAKAADPITLMLDWTPGGLSTGWYYGIQQRCFADRGIDLTVKRGFGAGDTVTKIAAGVAEFGVADLGVIIASRLKSGTMVKALLPLYSESPFGVAVLSDSPVKGLKDLEGKKVASTPSDAGMLFLPIAMRKAGGDFSKINKIAAEQATLKGLLLVGSVDALTTYVTTAVGIDASAQEIGKHVRSIPFGSVLDLYGTSLFASDALIAKNPDLVKRMTEGAVCAYQGAIKNQPAAMDAQAASVPGFSKDTMTDYTRFDYGFAFDNPTFRKNGFKWDQGRVVENIKVVREAQAIEAAADPSAIIYAP